MLGRSRRTIAIALYSMGVGAAGWALLVYVTHWDALLASLWPLLLFTALSLVLKRLGVHVVRDVTHSLVGIVDLAAIFVLGPTVGAWAAVLSGLAYLELRALRHHLFSWRFVGEHPIFSSGLKALMALACGHLYLRMGGAIAPTVVTWPMLLPLFTTIIVWYTADHIAWGTRAFLRGGKSGLLGWARSIATYSLLVELIPSPLSIVIALAYVGMGKPAFVLLSMALVASGALLQRLTDVGASLKERVAELAVLNDFGRALVEAQLDVKQLCELLYEYCGKIVDAPAFALELVRADQSQVEVAISVERGNRQAPFTVPMTETMKWMAGKREPFLSGNVKRDGLPFKPYVVGDLPQSLLLVPLLAGPQLIGTLSVQSYETYAFHEDELKVLSAMANQAAMAIANARVYEAEQRRAKQLTTIGEVSRRVAAILEIENLFAYVARLIQETFHYYHVGVFTVDADTGELVFRASTNPDIQEQGFEITKGHGIIAWVAEFGEPVLANDVSKEPRYAFLEALTDTQAELAMPLKVEQRIVGVLDVQSNELNAFSQDDIFVLQTLADQVAIAVEHARLYAARQEEAWSSTALLQVAEAVGSLDNLDEILQTVVRITPMLAGVDRCSILLWDEELQEFTWAQGYTMDGETQPLFDSMGFRPGDIPLLDQLLAQKSAIVAEGEEIGDLIPHNLAESFHIGSLLAVPLREQAEVFGVMLVDYLNPRVRFSDRKRTIVSGIADQAAMAIANSRLHVAQREEAWVSTALLQVAQAFESSPDLHENVSKIARLTPLLVGVDTCAVFLWEKERGEFLAYEAYGLEKDLVERFHSLHFAPGEMPLLDKLKQQQSYVAIEDASESELIPEEVRITFDIKAALGVPLISKGEMLGAFLVNYTQGPRRFTARKVSIIEGIAHQTTLAIENARLYQGALEQERSTQELRVAREIQVSFLPEGSPSLPGWEIAVDWHAARGVGGDFYDFIPLGRGRLGLVIADVSDKGVPAALFMSVTRTLVRASAAQTRSPAHALERVNDLIMTETRSGMFVTVFYAVLDWRTGRLTYANAGHNAPILWHNAESRTTTLSAKGIALGVVEDITLEERQIIMEPEDLLVLYTDGVTEPINEHEEEFGEERLTRMIVQTRDKPSTEVASLVSAAVSDFVGNQPQFDDYTLVAVKRQRQSK